MPERRSALNSLRRDHPLFFWGVAALVFLLISGSALIAVRVPQYRRQASEMERRMDEEEKATRDRILDSRTRRSELAIALLQRELRLKALQEKEIHLAISLEDSTLSLRHGPATLRSVRVGIGGDSIIRAPGGETWRLVRALGERHIRDKEVGATYTVPEWLYASRGQPIPPPEERRLDEGLGRYVIRLDDGTEIYTRPESGPFAEGVKPAAFVVDGEADMRAIFDSIQRDTPVYIY
jgi:hypothetical protein